MPLLTSKQHKGYVPNGRYVGIATSKHPTGVDQCIEVKVIHNRCVKYGRPEVRDNHKEIAAVQYFQSQARQQYVPHMKRKDTVHFGSSSYIMGPLESLFRQLDFKPMFFCKRAPMSRILLTCQWIMERSTWGIPWQPQHWIQYVKLLSADTRRIIHGFVEGVREFNARPYQVRGRGN